MKLVLVVILCSPIMSSHPGCLEDRYPLLSEVTPTQCVYLAQEAIAKKAETFGDGWKPARYGCVRGKG